MPNPVLATLALEIPTGAAPGEVHLLPPGPFRAEDGRPFDAKAWLLDATIAAQVAARRAAKLGDTLIDYEHQSLHAERNGQPAPAAGWFRALEWRDAGLYAVDVKWTERARSLIAAREYRYISAVFTYLPSSGEILELISAALTNTPALDGLDALIAARREATLEPKPKEPQMADATVAALSHERDSLKTEVAALKASVETLTTERDAAKAKLADYEAKAAKAALAAETAERDALISVALEGDAAKLVPAQEAWAKTQKLADLKHYLDTTPPIALLNRQTGGKASPAALSKDEAAFSEKLGVSKEAFLQAKGN
jgi:phage I-like protein